MSFNLNAFSRYQLFLLGSMGVLFELSFFIYDNTGGTMLVTKVGAEGISFIRVFLILPLILLTSYLYKTLLYSQRKELVFYLFITIFAALTLFYNFVLRPFSPILDVSKETLDLLAEQYPTWRVPLQVFGNWTTSFFYCITIIYCEVIFGLVLWKIADDVIVNKRLLFPLLTVLICLGGVLGSLLITLINKYYDWSHAMDIFTGLTLIIFLFLIVCYNKINLDFKRHTFLQKERKRAKFTNPATALSLKDTLKFILKDQVVFFLIMTVAFSYSHSIIELVWKDAVRQLYPSESDYSNFMALVSILSSIGFLALALFSLYTLKKWTWRMNTSSSTIMLFIFTVIFFGAFPFVGHELPLSMGHLILTPLVFTWIGALSMIFYPATDFGIYYPATRLTYGKMTSTQMENGRLGFELLGKNLGSTFVAAIIQIGLCVGSIQEIAPFLGITLAILCLVRFTYIKRLGNQLSMDD